MLIKLPKVNKYKYFNWQRNPHIKDDILKVTVLFKKLPVPKKIAIKKKNKNAR